LPQLRITHVLDGSVIRVDLLNRAPAPSIPTTSSQEEKKDPSLDADKKKKPKPDKEKLIGKALKMLHK
jgi:hypothetical protein